MSRNNILYPLVLGSLNLKNSLNMAELRDDLDRFIDIADPDIFGLQEFGAEWREDVMKRNRYAGRSFYRDDHTDNPVCWKSTMFDLLDAETRNIQAANSNWWRVGGSEVETVWATIMLFRHIESGRLINFLNTHTPPKPTLKNRRDAAISCHRAVGKWAKRRPPEEATVVVGDFNWDAAKDSDVNPEGYYPNLISQFEFNGETKTGTYGKRDYDYIFIRRNSEYHKPGHSGVVLDLKTDHDGVFWDTLLK